MRGWLQPKTQSFKLDGEMGRDPIDAQPKRSVLGIGYIPLATKDIPGSFNTSTELRDHLRRTDDPA